jgi:hypothetical protein
MAETRLQETTDLQNELYLTVLFKIISAVIITTACFINSFSYSPVWSVPFYISSYTFLTAKGPMWKQQVWCLHDSSILSRFLSHSLFIFFVGLIVICHAALEAKAKKQCHGWSNTTSTCGRDPLSRRKDNKSIGLINLGGEGVGLLTHSLLMVMNAGKFECNSKSDIDMSLRSPFWACSQTYDRLLKSLSVHLYACKKSRYVLTSV